MAITNRLDMKRVLRQLQFEQHGPDAPELKGLEIEIGPSNVREPPYDYVFIYLTDKRDEGTHIIVSDSGEYEDYHRYMVGLHVWAEANEFIPVRFVYQRDAVVAVCLICQAWRLAQRVRTV